MSRADGLIINVTGLEDTICLSKHFGDNLLDQADGICDLGECEFNT